MIYHWLILLSLMRPWAPALPSTHIHAHTHTQTHICLSQVCLGKRVPKCTGQTTRSDSLMARNLCSLPTLSEWLAVSLICCLSWERGGHSADLFIQSSLQHTYYRDNLPGALLRSTALIGHESFLFLALSCTWHHLSREVLYCKVLVMY